VTSGTVEALWARSVFSPVPVRNAFEVTVERLAGAIRLGVLAGGDRLPPERELAETFGVSRVTLREAIKALRTAKLVETRRGRGGGTFVVAPTVSVAAAPDRQRGTSSRLVLVEADGPETRPPLNDTLDLRRIVEPGAAALAASRTLSAPDRATLHRCLQEATDSPADTRRLADCRLHMAIAAAGGSSSVAAVVADVQMRLTELLRAIPVIAANIHHSDQQHAAIVDAILAGQPDRARAEMEEHVDGTAALLRGLLS
jgi:GntR family transcriptional regulator, transcriptional repressor for pyruvate dehydrogenase complex